MKFVIPIPSDPIKKQEINGLITGLEQFFKMPVYNAVIVETDADHIMQMLSVVAEHSWIPVNLPVKPAKIIEMKVCEYCGQLNKRKKSKYCSPACTQAAWKARKEAESK